MDSSRQVPFRGSDTRVDQRGAEDDASNSESSSSWTFTGVQAYDNEEEEDGSMSLHSPSVSRTVQIVLGDGSGSSGGGAMSSRPYNTSTRTRSDLDRKKEGFVLRASSSSIQHRPHRDTSSNAMRLVAQHTRKDDRFQLAGASSSASLLASPSSHVYDDDMSSTSSSSTSIESDTTVKRRREDRRRAPFEALNLDSDSMSKPVIHGAHLLRFGLLQAPRGMHICVRSSKTGDEQLWLWIDGITRPSHSSRSFALSYLLHHPEIMNHTATVNVAFPFFAARSFGTTIAQWDNEYFILSGAFLTCNDNALAGAFELRLKSVAPTPLVSAEKESTSSTSANNTKKSKKKKFSVLATAAPSSAASNSIMAGTLRLSNKRQSIDVFIRSWDDIAPTWQQVPFLYGDPTILPGAKIRYDRRLWTFVAWHKPQSNCVVIRYGDREAKRDVVFCRKIVRLYTQPLDLDSSSSSSTTSSSYEDDDVDYDVDQYHAADDHKTNDTDSVYLSTLSNGESSSSSNSLSMSDDDADDNADRATQQLIPSQSTSSSMRRAANAAPYRPSQ